jgi:galactokinase/mevalonate kinase-like predicted kinase
MLANACCNSSKFDLQNVIRNSGLYVHSCSIEDIFTGAFECSEQGCRLFGGGGGGYVPLTSSFAASPLNVPTALSAFRLQTEQ